MFLRSGKVMKLSSANNQVTEQDFISKLPDTLLTHILSLLPDADACRTSVWSKRWKDLWMFLPNVHFVMPDSSTEEQASEYYDFVEKILANRDGLPIRRFFLYCWRVYDYRWMMKLQRIAVQCKVQILVLRSPPHTVSVCCCWDMFKTCETLVELTLEGQFTFDLPKDEVFFPCLKKISLVSVQYSDKPFENLITSCCPVLEELVLERRELHYLNTIKISSISLKRLRIYNTVDLYDKFVIDAPKLEYLNIEDKKEFGCYYSFTKKPSSLVEAYIDTNTDSVDHILTNISTVKVLTLTCPTIRAFYEVHAIDERDELDELNGLNVPVFLNLVKLVIDMHDIQKWHLLFVFLHNMPNLEHITFLNILTVNGHELDPMWLEALLKFHRGSNLCGFKIV